MVNNIIKVIDDIHKAVLHQGKAKMIDVINEKKYFIMGLNMMLKILIVYVMYVFKKK